MTVGPAKVRVTCLQGESAKADENQSMPGFILAVLTCLWPHPHQPCYLASSAERQDSMSYLRAMAAATDLSQPVGKKGLAESINRLAGGRNSARTSPEK
jgi:hypothetical protein